MSRQAKWAIALLIGSIVIAATLIALRHQPEEKPVEETVPLVEVEAYTVNSAALEVWGTGTVRPREEVALGTEIAGRIVWVNPAFREGSYVGRGATLFRVDPVDYRNRVRIAQADVAAQNVVVQQAQQEVAIAEVELDRFVERESSRLALSRSIDDNDYAARILPPNGLDMAGERSRTRTAAPNRLATREPQLLAARAALERARAQLADAQLALARTAVSAPFSGIVQNEDLSVGTQVQPGQVLGTMVAASAYEVSVSLTESQAALIPGLFAAGGANTPAAVELDYGGNTWRWNAVVDRADPILNPETRMIEVFLRVSDPLRGGMATGDAEEPGSSPPLLLGSFVNASITGGVGEPYAIIPLRALREGNTVWLLAGGKLRIVDVDVIQRTDRFAYVSSSQLGNGGNVITSDLRTPVDGMQLRAERAGEAASGD